MKKDEIKAMQRRIGVVADGVWGPLSMAACRAHLRGLMPKVNPWPKAERTALEAFYGRPGDEAQLVSFTFPYPMFYDGRRVLTSRCHRRVKDSLLRVLTEIGDRWGGKRGIMEEAEDYGGIYHFRNSRGGSALSMHAWGIAIDLDADDNGLHAPWPSVADMPLEIMEAFAKEGWLAAGAFWSHRTVRHNGYDAMHFQATR
jgi:hypothetical protein